MPAAFQRDAGVTDPQLSEPVSLGTTIVAVSFEGGVVLAADSRTSSGAYVVNRVSNKLTKLTDRIYCCRSGSAADTQALAEMTSNYLEQHAVDTKRPATVAAAAGLFQKLCYNNKWNISAGILVAGYDEINGGSVYTIPPGGCSVKLDYAMGGSGSIFLYAWMDSHYKKGMTRDQCVNFVREAVSHAISRDGSSGGVVRTIALDATGATHTTTPWPQLPYRIEADPQFTQLAIQNPPVSSTSKLEKNRTDSHQ
jgi:20S proteasome subunit beta 1